MTLTGDEIPHSASAHTTPKNTEPMSSNDCDHMNEAPTNEDTIDVSFAHHGEKHTFTLPTSATISDLSDTISSTLSVPPENQKLLVSPKPGLLKPPFKDPSLPLSVIVGRKITLMGSTSAELQSLNASLQQAQKRAQPRTWGGVKPAQPTRHRDWKQAKDEAMYTFHTLRPLPYLPKPERSLRFLERLRDDPGIKASMRKHQFSVPLLTEMDPAAHTTHESRTLGLNRNRGEVIELRLRTDAYDGYRDYKTIRKTLCHELSHNVWGEHDRNFWELTKQIEREVEKNDWSRGGHSVGNQEFAPEREDVWDEDFVADHGGWQGGEFVLGGGEAGSVSNGAIVCAQGDQHCPGNLSRRDILAKAAEERARKQNQMEGKASREGSPRRSSPPS